MKTLPIIPESNSSRPRLCGTARPDIALPSHGCLLLQRLLTLAVILLTVTCGTVLRAQDDDFDDEEEDAPAEVQVAAVPMKQFDQWVFGHGNNHGAKSTKKRLESLLTLHVDSISQICDLSEAQNQKLILAGHGDIKRFYDSVNKVRVKFLAMRNDQNQRNQIWQITQPLQMKLNAGIFDEKSLFHKVRKRLLKPEQVTKYEEVESERRRFRYEASVGMAVSKIEQGMPLRDEQRNQLLKLLLEETRPPKIFGQHDYYVVMFQASKIPEKKLRPIFDDAQWRALSKQLNQVKGMGEFLKKNNILP